MKRTFEFTLVLIVSILTISATGTVIHDLNAGKPDPFASWLNQQWKAVSSWARGTAIPTLVQPSHGAATQPPTFLHSKAEIG